MEPIIKPVSFKDQVFGVLQRNKVSRAGAPKTGDKGREKDFEIKWERQK